MVLSVINADSQKISALLYWFNDDSANPVNNADN
jgi:hypothetical protein